MSERRKYCGDCARWLLVGGKHSAFHRDSQRPDGHESRCKECRKLRHEELEQGAKRYKPWQKRRACSSYSQAS